MFLVAVPPAPILNPNDWAILIFRVSLAVLMGAVIGWNRETSGKAAGLRTHMLVSLGAAMFVMASLTMGASADALSRAIQGVATGIGFLGAGEILQRRSESGKWVVKGLTSAASIWVTAALGVLAGCGLWQLCFLSALMALVILIVAKWLERQPPS